MQASVADATLEFRGYSTDRQLLNELDLLIDQLGLKILLHLVTMLLVKCWMM